MARYIQRPSSSLMQQILQLVQGQQQEKRGERAAFRRDIFAGGESVARGFQQQRLEKKQAEEREKERKQKITAQDAATRTKMMMSGYGQMVQPTQTQLPSGVAGPQEAPQFPATSVPIPSMGGGAIPGMQWQKRARPRAGYTEITPSIVNLIKLSNPKRGAEAEGMLGTFKPTSLVNALMKPARKTGMTLVTPVMAEVMISYNPEKKEMIEKMIDTDQSDKVVSSLLRRPLAPRAAPKTEFEKYLATTEGKEIQKLVAAGKGIPPASAEKLKSLGVTIEKKKYRVPWAKQYEVPEGLVPEEMKEKPKEYKTAEDVKAAFAAGDLNKEEAAKLLREKFGYD